MREEGSACQSRIGVFARAASVLTSRTLLGGFVHASAPSQRPHSVGCAALFPTSGRWRQQRSHRAFGVFETSQVGVADSEISRSLRMKISSASARTGARDFNSSGVAPS